MGFDCTSENGKWMDVELLFSFTTQVSLAQPKARAFALSPRDTLFWSVKAHANPSIHIRQVKLPLPHAQSQMLNFFSWPFAALTKPMWTPQTLSRVPSYKAKDNFHFLLLQKDLASGESIASHV